MLSPEKVATPATAATVLVPDKVPLLGFVPIATVTFPVNPVAVLPLPSWAVTWTSGVLTAPAPVALDCTGNTSCVPVPAVTLHAALFALPAPAAVRAQPAPPFPYPTLFRSATPATAATVFVPDKVPLLGFVPIATVTFPVNPVAVFPLASWAVTWTAGVIAAPAVVVLGCTAKTSWVAAPAVMLNPALVPVRPPLLTPSV